MADLCIDKRGELLKERIRQMRENDEWHLFQTFCGRCLAQMGYTDVRLSKVRGDFGRDAVAVDPQGSPCFVAISFDGNRAKVMADAGHWSQDPNREPAEVMVFMTWDGAQETHLSKWREEIKNKYDIGFVQVHEESLLAAATPDRAWYEVCDLLGIRDASLRYPVTWNWLESPKWSGISAIVAVIALVAAVPSWLGGPQWYGVAIILSLLVLAACAALIYKALRRWRRAGGATDAAPPARTEQPESRIEVVGNRKSWQDASKTIYDQLQVRLVKHGHGLLKLERCYVKDVDAEMTREIPGVMISSWDLPISLREDGDSTGWLQSLSTGQILRILYPNLRSDQYPLRIQILFEDAKGKFWESNTIEVPSDKLERERLQHGPGSSESGMRRLYVSAKVQKEPSSKGREWVLAHVSASSLPVVLSELSVIHPDGERYAIEDPLFSVGKLPCDLTSDSPSGMFKICLATLVDQIQQVAPPVPRDEPLALVFSGPDAEGVSAGLLLHEG